MENFLNYLFRLAEALLAVTILAAIVVILVEVARAVVW